MKSTLSKVLMFVLTLTLLVSSVALANPKITIWAWDPAFNIYAMEEAAKI